jgi:hypothetical protein
MKAGRLENLLTNHQAANPVAREAKAVQGNWILAELVVWVFGNCMFLNLFSAPDRSRQNGWQVMRLKPIAPHWIPAGRISTAIERLAAVWQNRLTTNQLLPSFIRTVTVGCEISSHPVIPLKTGLLVGFNHRSGISPCPEGHDN